MTEPIRLPLYVEGPNGREHWQAKHRRVKGERGQVCWAFTRARLEGRTIPKPTPDTPAIVTLTRVGKRLLDDDNLQGAMKAIRDQVARELGCGDSPRDPIRWEYAQRIGDAYAVEIQVGPT